MMDGQPCRNFFLEPQSTLHRRYEALRAFFVEDRPVPEIAARFGYKPTALKVMISRFRTQSRRGDVPPSFSPTAEGGRPAGGARRAPTAPRSRRSPIGGSWTSGPGDG